MRRRHRFLVAAGLIAPACSPAPTAHRGRDHVSAIPLADAGPDATVAGATTSTGPAPTSPEGTTGSTAPAPSLGPVPTVPSGATTVTFTLPTAPRTTTTLVLPELADEELSDAQWWAVQPGHVAPEPGRKELLACIRSYEQGEDGYATDTGNGFYGAYQFDLATWRSVGGTGSPADASPAEQDARAWALYESRGLAPWPTPSRRCG